MNRSSTSNEISFHGLPSKSKPQYQETDRMVVIITVDSITKQPSAEIFSKRFFRQQFFEFLKNSCSASTKKKKKTFLKFLESSQKNTRGEILFQSSCKLLQKQPPEVFCKKMVFLEKCSQNSQENTCVRDSILIKGYKKQTSPQVFSCEFLRKPFLQNTSAFSFSLQLY